MVPPSSDHRTYDGRQKATDGLQPCAIKSTENTHIQYCEFFGPCLNKLAYNHVARQSLGHFPLAVRW